MHRILVYNHVHTCRSDSEVVHTWCAGIYTYVKTWSFCMDVELQGDIIVFHTDMGMTPKV